RYQIFAGTQSIPMTAGGIHVQFKGNVNLSQRGRINQGILDSYRVVLSHREKGGRRVGAQAQLRAQGISVFLSYKTSRINQNGEIRSTAHLISRVHFRVRS